MPLLHHHFYARPCRLKDAASALPFPALVLSSTTAHRVTRTQQGRHTTWRNSRTRRKREQPVDPPPCRLPKHAKQHPLPRAYDRRVRTGTPRHNRATPLGISTYLQPLWQAGGGGKKTAQRVAQYQESTVNRGSAVQVSETSPSAPSSSPRVTGPAPDPAALGRRPPPPPAPP